MMASAVRPPQGMITKAGGGGAATTVTPPKKVGGLEKGMLEELLLVCTFVGTKRAVDDDSSAVDDFVRGEDCVVRARRPSLNREPR